MEPVRLPVVPGKARQGTARHDGEPCHVHVGWLAQRKKGLCGDERRKTAAQTASTRSRPFAQCYSCPSFRTMAVQPWVGRRGGPTAPVEDTPDCKFLEDESRTVTDCNESYYRTKGGMEGGARSNSGNRIRWTLLPRRGRVRGPGRKTRHLFDLQL